MKLILVLFISSVLGFLLTPYYEWASFLFLISIFFLALVYFALGWVMFLNEKMKFKVTKDLVFSKFTFNVIAGWAISVILIGIMFKLRFFPGDKLMLQVGGLVDFVVVAIAAFSMIRTKEDKVVYRNVLLNAILALILGLAVYLTPYESVIRFYILDKNKEEQLVQLYKSGDREEFFDLFMQTLTEQREKK